MTSGKKHEQKSELRANLRELTHIPAKEFEKQFREWMDRDEVARRLQAQLRMDLIKNFNNTILGKQILALTTTTGNSFCPATEYDNENGQNDDNRLTIKISPLMLALNTLIAEFLYAQNCHFTLSVFCTEIPYRNSLPDFENRQKFRFRAGEIRDIIEALFGAPALMAATKFEALKHNIETFYLENRYSLLFTLIKMLLDQLQQQQNNVEQTVQKITTSNKATQIAKQQRSKSPNSVRNFGTMTIADHKNITKKPVKLKTIGINTIKISSTSIATNTYAKKPSPLETIFNQLDKYLLALTNNIKDMTTFCEHNTESLKPITTSKQSPVKLDFATLNRSLVTIAQNLKRITSEPFEQKALGELMNVIMALGQCAQNLQTVLNKQAKFEAMKIQEYFNKNDKANIKCQNRMQQTSDYEQQHNCMRLKNERRMKTKTTMTKTCRLESVAQQTDETRCPRVHTHLNKCKNASTCTKKQMRQNVAQQTELLLPKSRANLSAATQTQLEPAERSYEDWVNEMNSTPNGEIFLDRIESALHKAINKTKSKLAKEFDLKMQHQRDLFKLRYKRKVMEYWCKQVAGDASKEARELTANIEKHLSHYEARQVALLEKIQANEMHTMQLANGAQLHLEQTIEAPKRAQQEVYENAIKEEAPKQMQYVQQQPLEYISHYQPLQQQQQSSEYEPPQKLAPMKPPPVHRSNSATQTTAEHRTQPRFCKKNLESIIQSVVDQDRKVDSIVNNAKLRIQELESESSVLEKSFLNYLERQRLERETTREATQKLLTECTKERQQIHETVDRLRDCNAIQIAKAGKHDEPEEHALLMQRLQKDQQLREQRIEQLELPKTNVRTTNSAGACEDDSSGGFVFQNAIAIAKRKFFADGHNLYGGMKRTGGGSHTHTHPTNVNIEDELLNVNNHHLIANSVNTQLMQRSQSLVFSENLAEIETIRHLGRTTPTPTTTTTTTSTTTTTGITNTVTASASATATTTTTNDEINSFQIIRNLEQRHLHEHIYNNDDYVFGGRCDASTTPTTTTSTTASHSNNDSIVFNNKATRIQTTDASPVSNTKRLSEYSNNKIATPTTSTLTKPTTQSTSITIKEQTNHQISTSIEPTTIRAAAAATTTSLPPSQPTTISTVNEATTKTSSHKLKQSMEKMQQLFAQQTNKQNNFDKKLTDFGNVLAADIVVDATITQQVPAPVTSSPSSSSSSSSSSSASSSSSSQASPTATNRKTVVTSKPTTISGSLLLSPTPAKAYSETLNKQKVLTTKETIASSLANVFDVHSAALHQTAAVTIVSSESSGLLTSISIDVDDGDDDDDVSSANDDEDAAVGNVERKRALQKHTDNNSSLSSNQNSHSSSSEIDFWLNNKAQNTWR